MLQGSLPQHTTTEHNSRACNKTPGSSYQQHAAQSTRTRRELKRLPGGEAHGLDAQRAGHLWTAMIQRDSSGFMSEGKNPWWSRRFRPKVCASCRPPTCNMAPRRRRQTHAEPLSVPPHLEDLPLHMLLLLRLAQHRLQAPQAELLLAAAAIDLSRQQLHVHPAIGVRTLLLGRLHY